VCRRAGLRVDERVQVRAHQQEDDIGGLKLFADTLIHVVARDEPPVVPDGNHALALQHRKLRLQLITENFVLVGIREEEGIHSGAPKTS
jgi:hypothetical protein